jgi:ATP-binding cassette, subfamily A (ABC1), member 3
MEECEPLCNRLVIMVNGKICCIGSPQQLKNKFEKGYTLMIKVSTAMERRLSRTSSESPTRSMQTSFSRQTSYLSNDVVLTRNINEVKTFVSTSLPSSELKGVHNNLLHYHITDKTLTCSKLFGIIERAKERLKIEDYSVGQTTLEQIFLSFARQQSRVTRPPALASSLQEWTSDYGLQEAIIPGDRDLEQFQHFNDLKKFQ